MTSLADTPVYVVAAKRTPFGAFGGKLAGLTATDLAVHAARACLRATSLDPGAVDHVIFGNVCQTAADAIYLPRHVGLRCEIPIEVPALGVQRLCGSGFQAVASGAMEILLGTAQVVLVGGTESMSQAPHAVRGLRFGGPRLGQSPALEDTLWSALTDPWAGCAMAITAENLAKLYGIDRAACDAYALRSQQAWAAASAAGRFEAELAPMELPGRKGPETFAVDEHPRPDTTAEALARLAPVFQRDGVVTAGNASGICDGAAALLLCGEAGLQRHGLQPLARLLAWHTCGVEPKHMGLGPVPAIRGAVERAGITLEDAAIVEINEAFAPQLLACEKQLGVARERLNPDGGAIALGHPLGASGARITTHLVHELRRRGQRWGVGAACIGGGQGIALVLQNVP
jgi:acetyl-CoA acetyltransferase family protein